MVRISISVLAGIALVFAPTAFAQTAGAAPAGLQAPLKAKKICKSEATVGTRFQTKICKTAEEWAALQSRDREALDSFKRSACMGGAASASGNGQSVAC